MEALERAGHPVVRIELDDESTSARSSSGGRSRPRWPESILGINPFDQPDVEASKMATRKLTVRLRTNRARSRRDSVLC